MESNLTDLALDRSAISEFKTQSHAWLNTQITQDRSRYSTVERSSIREEFHLTSPGCTGEAVEIDLGIHKAHLF